LKIKEKIKIKLNYKNYSSAHIFKTDNLIFLKKKKKIILFKEVIKINKIIKIIVFIFLNKYFIRK
jgi:hypothetical protein